MIDYYSYKDELLSLFKPVCVHRQHLGKETKKVTSTNKKYLALYEKHESRIVYENSYYDDFDREVEFFVYETSKEKYLYFLYYEIGGFSFHKPINKAELQLYKNLEIKDLDDNFITDGRDINDLLSMNFVKKVIDLIHKDDFLIIE